MIAFIHCLSFLVIALTAGYLLKVTLSDMLPFVWCGLILVLYVLAYGRILFVIDTLMPLAAVALAVCVWRGTVSGTRDASAGSDLISYARENLLSGGFITYIILCIVIPLTQSARIVTWWDDINYWACDLKSLYYLGGFAGKYANVSSAYGDYPPAVQLAKWYLVHMDPHEFKESLAFTGYYLFNLSFIMPCFKKITGRRLVLCPLLALAAWGFAGIGDIFGYSGFCADLSMAFLFGSVLICAVEEDLALTRTSVYLAVLVIAKSTGMIWALFGFAIWFVYRLLNTADINGKKILRMLSVGVLPVLTGGIWMLFCLVNRRVTQSTSTMVTYITTDRYGLSPYKNEFGAAFIRAFLTEPVHVTHTWFDLSPAMMAGLITVLLILLRITGFIKGRGGTFVCVALPVTGIVYYVLIYIAHLTIFALETQYLDPEGMIASIERYGAPFMIGCMLFIARLWMMRDAQFLAVRVFLLSVLVLTNIPEAYRGIMGYRTELRSELKNRSGFIEEESVRFLEVIWDEDRGILSGNRPGGSAVPGIGKGLRICRVRDGAYYYVQDAYVAYEASPVSVICPSMDIKDTPAGVFTDAVLQTHAGYLYVDSQVYEDTYLDDMVADGDFEYCCLYRIDMSGGQMKLVKCD